MDEIRALSVLDGRYSNKVGEIRDIFSEYGLIKQRLFVEISWLKFILKDLRLSDIDAVHMKKIEKVFDDFDLTGALRIKEIEGTTNHDVKALEYFIKEELEKLGLSSIKEWVHFSCTSEDINNTAYALMLKEGTGLLQQFYLELLKEIEEKALLYKDVVMMSRTHGQPASPTTLGKEFVNFAWRIKQEIEILEKIDFSAKMNGASGNFNAHYFVFPDIDWIEASKTFLTQYLQLRPLIFTTQINPYGYISQIMHSLTRLSSIIIDLDRDIWGYISIGYFKQKLSSGEIGSSTMPHKVNPIDFENSEGNMGVAIAMMEHLAVKLQNSRFQRDLTDSTVLRNLGAIYGYALIGIKSTLKGLRKLDLNREKMSQDLKENLELLAEPLQTMMRVSGEANPYEKLKELTRGQKISREQLDQFIEDMESVTIANKKRMKELTPENYIGLAAKLVDNYFS